jgi:large subunit ribosomal protein L22
MATTIKKTTPVKKIVASKKEVTVKTVAPKIEAPIETKKVLAKFINKNLKVSPRKLRLVVVAVKKLDPVTAIGKLKFTNSNAARLLCKCLEDAVASAKHNYNLLPQSLYFTDFRVDEGMKIKRMDKSHGSRFARGIIQKRHSRLVIVLSGTIQG